MRAKVAFRLLSSSAPYRVQILSPRLVEGRGLAGEIQRVAAFTLRATCRTGIRGHSMKRLTPVCMLLAATGCATSRLECTVHDGPSWHEARSSRLLVRSNLETAELQTQVAYLEQLLAAMQTVLGGAPAPVPEPIPVILLHPGDLAALGHDPKKHGDLYGPQRAVLIEARGATRQWPTPAHELAHLVIARAMPGAAKWLREGLASWLETATFEDDVHLVQLGLGQVGYQYEVLTDRGLALAELWQWGRGDEPLDASRYRAFSWGIVHYLMSSEAARFRQVLEALRRGEDGELAFKTSFPSFERRDLPAALEHINGGLFTGTTLSLPESPQPPVLRELSAGEVHRSRAEVFTLAHGLGEDERQQRSTEELTLAAELDAQGPAPQEQPEPLPPPPPPFVAATAPRLGEPDLVWSANALSLTAERPSEAARLIDEAPAIFDFVALRRVWVAAAVLGDCELLGRVQQHQVPRFETSNAAETTQMKRRYETLCGSAAPVPAFTCGEGQLGYPDDVLNALLADRTRKMGTLTGAVSSVDEIDGDLTGTVPLTVRADGSTEVGAVTLQPPKRLLMTAFTQLYQRLPFPKPCGGDVAYDVPVSFMRPKK